jgi:hypothetical protein
VEDGVYAIFGSHGGPREKGDRRKETGERK